MDERASDSIADELERMILTGAFAEGARLSEAALAERFGVSRTPVREAFQRLTSTGLIEQLPHRGAFIRKPGPAELLELFEAMSELEAMCGRLAAIRISNTALAEMKTANTDCSDAAAADDAEAYYRANEVFHHIIYAECGNSFLEQSASRLYRRLRPYRRMQLQVRGRMAQSLKEHERIFAALSASDPQSASDVLRGHVAVQGEKFHHLISSISKARA